MEGETITTSESQATGTNEATQFASNESQPSATPNRAGLSAFYGENGLNTEAVSELPEDASALKSLLNKYPNEQAFHSGLKNLQYLASQKGLSRLPDDASDADKANQQKMLKEFFQVPDQPDGYGIQKPEGIPDEYWNKEGTDALLGILHKHNASPELVRELAQHQVEALQKALQPNEEAEQARKEQINNEIREAFKGETKEVLEAAKKGLAVLGIDLPESGDIADLQIPHTKIIEAGKLITEMISEDAMDTITHSERSAVESLQQQSMAIKNDPSNPFYADFNSGDPEREARAQKEFLRLRKQIEQINGARI